MLEYVAFLQASNTYVVHDDNLASCNNKENWGIRSHISIKNSQEKLLSLYLYLQPYET